MRYTTVDRYGTNDTDAGIAALTLYVGRLLRHPAYRRERVVSPLFLRHLPFDAGYAWHGEDQFRTRIARAGLDRASLAHLLGNAKAEFARLRTPSDA